MAGDASAAAVADENNLVAGAVRFMGGLAHPLASVRQGNAFRSAVRNLRSMKGIRQRRKISIKPLAHQMASCHEILLKKAGDALDEGRLLDRPPVADNFHLQRPDHVAY